MSKSGENDKDPISNTSISKFKIMINSIFLFSYFLGAYSYRYTPSRGKVRRIFICLFYVGFLLTENIVHLSPPQQIFLVLEEQHRGFVKMSADCSFPANF